MWRVLIAVLTLAPIGALVQVGLLQAGVLADSSAWSAPARSRSPMASPTRAAAALVATAAIAVVMSGVSRAAKAQARGAIAGHDGEVIDVVADANPGVPWCWAVMVLQKAGNDPRIAVATRATLSLLPASGPRRPALRRG